MRFLPGLAVVSFPTLDAPTVVPCPNTEGTIGAGRLVTDKSLGKSLPPGTTPTDDDAMKGTSSPGTADLESPAGTKRDTAEVNCPTNPFTAIPPTVPSRPRVDSMVAFTTPDNSFSSRVIEATT